MSHGPEVAVPKDLGSGGADGQELTYNGDETVAPVEDGSSIPPTSLIREFIGGSAYEY